MKHRFRTCLAIICLALGSQAFCQEKFITLAGKVTDAGTRQPVPYANIQLKTGSAGTVSNTSGGFVFKIPLSGQQDSLLVSCIGYSTLALPVPAADQPDMHITLQPAVMQLREVAVGVHDGTDILRQAVARIPDNYDTADARLTAFYREDIRLNGDTMNFIESVLDIYKTFHDGKGNNDQIRIIKGRKKNIKPLVDPQLHYYISNISNTAYSTLREDLQKYHYARQNVLNPRNFRYYNCHIGETVREGDRNLLVLYMTPKNNSRKALVRAKIYLDETSLAILRCELDVTPAGVAFVNRHGKGGIRYTITSKIIKATLDFTALRMVVTYKQYKGKTYLHTVHRHWECVINSRKRNIKNMPWIADLNLLVTDVNKDSVRRFATIANNNSSMNNLVGSDYDAAFWENYNILQPVLPDSLRSQPEASGGPAILPPPRAAIRVSNRQNGFTRADTLRGQLSPLRSCYDVTFYHLDVDVNLNARYIKGNNKIRFKATAPFQTMQVDLYANMKINKVLYNGQPLSYTREYDAVFIRLPHTLPAGSSQEITIYYEGSPQTPNWSIPMHGGALWDKDEQGNPWAQMVCQGSGASLWWPNKDHLSDEPDSMRIWVTVPNGFTEISNGRLQRTTPATDSTTRYEWLVSYPINNYNVTFGIGKYAHYTDRYVNGDTLTIDYYVMPYNLQRAKALFKQVKPMLQCFERCFGKYPFPRDGFTLVESPYPMEHQSGVCIGKIKPDTDTNYTAVLWHESAHEWWGNAISCKDIADMWMHEAFATYAEALVVECTNGKDAALEFIDDHRNGVHNNEPVIGEYDVNHIHYEIGDMYTKGGLMLNTFRHVLDNDTLWFGLLKDIQQHFRYRTLSSDELVRYICRRTGKDYTAFFDQYLKHTNLPTLQIALKEQGNNLQVKYRWQADVPGFSMPVKVTTAVDRFSFIHPGPEWKTVTLKNMTAGDFEVDEERFYIKVEETE